MDPFVGRMFDTPDLVFQEVKAFDFTQIIYL